MNTEQFNQQVISLQDKLFRYALSIVYDWNLAKDIVQEVFLKCWKKREQLDQVLQIEAWCVRLTRNCAYDKLKAKSNQTVDLTLADHHFSPELSQDQSAEYADLINSIQRILKDLPERQREIFRLRDIMGYSNQEIEEMMDLNDNQVKVYLYRARRKVKDKLTKIMNYGIRK